VMRSGTRRERVKWLLGGDNSKVREGVLKNVTKLMFKREKRSDGKMKRRVVRKRVDVLMREKGFKEVMKLRMGGERMSKKAVMKWLNGMDMGDDTVRKWESARAASQAAEQVVMDMMQSSDDVGGSNVSSGGGNGGGSDKNGSDGDNNGNNICNKNSSSNNNSNISNKNISNNRISSNNNNDNINGSSSSASGSSSSSSNSSSNSSRSSNSSSSRSKSSNGCSKSSNGNSSNEGFTVGDVVGTLWGEAEVMKVCKDGDVECKWDGYDGVYTVGGNEVWVV
jgi:hypothetical protein